MTNRFSMVPAGFPICGPFPGGPAFSGTANKPTSAAKKRGGSVENLATSSVRSRRQVRCNT